MRHASIDAVRALAIVLMVLVHFTENLAGWVIPFAGSGAPMFVVLSGVSFALWVESQQRRGITAEEITRRGVRRGVFLFLVGLLFNVAVWMPEDVFNWDVLTLIGTGLVVLILARNAPSPRTSRRIAPASVLCAMSGESILRATGPCMSRAWAIASSILVARCCCVTAKP